MYTGPMAPGGRKSEPPGALESALRLLSHRGRSRHELSALLSRRGFPAGEVSQALSRLAELGYLDDARFAQHRALSLLRDGKLGPLAVMKRLAAHGLSDRVVRRALADASAELGFEPLSAARALLERRGLAGERLSPKERAKAARLLTARGFDEEVVSRLLGEVALDPAHDGD